MIIKLLQLPLNMEIFMITFLFWEALVFDLVLTVSGDALNALKTNLIDPNNVLQSWDPSLANPCTWFHVTCNSESSVTRIDLGNANLSGQLVPQLGQLTNLRYLELYSNNISGRIPDELGNLTNLVSLDLYLNGLTGPIPASLGNLQKLRFLRLNNNSLSGNIPMTLTNAASLEVLDLSNNHLGGDTSLSDDITNYKEPLIPIDIIYPNNTGLIPSELSPASTISSMPPASSGNSALGAIAGAVVAGSTLLVAALAILFALWRKRKPQHHSLDAPAETDTKVDLPAAEEDTKVHLGQLKRFSLSELEFATDNFSKENILGRGGFVKVYKGCLADDGSLVAVKRLKKDGTQAGEQQFQTEVEMISMAVHPNLLQLRGFCTTTTEWLLVYPFMENGSVASCLQGRPKSRPPLKWGIRKPIAMRVARGLAYLHDQCEQKIIHHDIKTANILLDEKFEVVIGDFGLAKLMDHKANHINTNVRGTIGYIAPEYYSTGKSSEKTDVFAYGVMLLELITGRDAVNLARRANDNNVILRDWVKGIVKDKKLGTLIDRDLQGQYNEEEVEQLIQVALLCTQDSPKKRPKMSEVVTMLEGNDLAKKWGKWQQEELFLRENMFQQDFNHAKYPKAVG